ncbi:MAG: hypothetical protein RLO81_06895 [Fulvivirga sp.]|uniref:hypothetical protein n=1 Tax=Fulvivirga sp. TaxID=1931237 RepID=UPI0032ED82EB
MKYSFFFFLVLISSSLMAQLTFESKSGKFKVDVSVEPTEEIDTIQSDYRLIPWYKMISTSVNHGRNLLY